MPSAQDIIEQLALQPHPEGGYYRETFRDSREIEGRSCSTAIYYLLPDGQRSHWHRVDATEPWLFHAGAPLELSIAQEGQKPVLHMLGSDVLAHQCPQVIVPERHWQSAVSTGAWTLVTCTVAPAFEFSGFEMAPPDWQP